MLFQTEMARSCLQTNPGLQKLVAGMVGLPFGLLMVLICGAELFTGNTCIMACAAYERRCSVGQLLRNWVVSYAGKRSVHSSAVPRSAA